MVWNISKAEVPNPALYENLRQMSVVFINSVFLCPILESARSELGIGLYYFLTISPDSGMDMHMAVTAKGLRRFVFANTRCLHKWGVIMKPPICNWLHHRSVGLDVAFHVQWNYILYTFFSEIYLLTNTFFSFQPCWRKRIFLLSCPYFISSCHVNVIMEKKSGWFSLFRKRSYLKSG